MGSGPVRGGAAAAVDLSVVIVNYNVEYFLDQCLRSVARASVGLAVEVFVVDNDSRDGSLAMLRRHPDVRVIANRANAGFAKANNLALRRARGRYLLLLNPDTLVPPVAFARCLRFCDANPDTGALGVRMVDGTGAYLPESKRGFPTPWVSFAKMSGLARLAPHNPRYNGYYLGHLGEHETHVVDVLPGAFMWLRREALAAAGGGLDEDYFMYGEDIDLSYCIQRAGYDVVYFPEVSIVHYKGESTRKRSLGYVRRFYAAMAIFSAKHVRPQGVSGVAAAGLKLAIYARAALAVILNAVAALLPLAVDAVVVVALALAAKAAWAEYYFANPTYYDSALFNAVILPIYASLWLIGLRAMGAHDRPYRILAAARGALVGTLLILIVYALLPTELRVSRAIVILAGGGAALALPLLRVAWSLLRPGEVAFTQQATGRERRLAVVGTPSGASRVLELLARAGIAREYIGRIDTQRAGGADPLGDGEVIGDVADTPQLAVGYGVQELVYDLDAVGVDTLIDHMAVLGDRVEYRTVHAAAAAIVGSPSRDAPGELYTVRRPAALAERRHLRSKRLADVALAAVLLLGALPIAIAANRPLGVLRNALRVLLGGATWVGYAPGGAEAAGLPQLRPAVLPQGLDLRSPKPRDVQRLNDLYARSYSVAEDFRTVWQYRSRLARRPLAITRVAPARWPASGLPAVDYTDPYGA